MYDCGHDFTRMTYVEFADALRLLEPDISWAEVDEEWLVFVFARAAYELKQHLH
jgi:hypothetical protein